ncbi:hypothetical protein POM88_029014 [Heracleum sosnowskyi]|uniref:Transposase-associated domain-containing protein n=1 Tax=Heracleum sosnowskyi TaxID=360622 RepID=A0AAD8HTY6_9APIA|nr:hypothetical protein POM88_029014 [Heracleum sosnowskyi]
MASDRSWIGHHLREEDNGLMRCPCRNCGNGTYKKPSTVKLDLYRHGIMQWYTIWDCHGEKDEPHDEVGTSSVNTNHRDDDDAMYDAHDDDFEDCEDFEEEPNATAKEFYKMVTWDGPKGRENKHKNNKVITSGEGGEAHEGSEEESHVEGCYEVGESSCPIKFERKRRSNSEGDYRKKPDWDARPTVYFLKNDKGLFQATPKKTLGHIVRLKWDEHTLNTKGAKREAFYDSCIKFFKEYYAYPKIYDPEDGDRVVRAHLKRNFKSYLNAERGRLMQDVNEILKRGYPESVINIRLMRPYYFSQRAWNAICDHW